MAYSVPFQTTCYVESCRRPAKEKVFNRWNDFNGTPLYVTEGSATSYDSMVPAYLHGMRLTRDRKLAPAAKGGA